MNAPTEPRDDTRLGALIRSCIDEELLGVEFSPVLLLQLIIHR